MDIQSIIRSYKVKKTDQQNQKKQTRGFGGDWERVEALGKMNLEADKYSVPTTTIVPPMYYEVPGTWL